MRKDQTIRVRVVGETKRLAQARAAEHGMSLSVFLRLIIEQNLHRAIRLVPSRSSRARVAS